MTLIKLSVILLLLVLLFCVQCNEVKSECLNDSWSRKTFTDKNQNSVVIYTLPENQEIFANQLTCIVIKETILSARTVPEKVVYGIKKASLNKLLLFKANFKENIAFIIEITLSAKAKKGISHITTFPNPLQIIRKLFIGENLPKFDDLTASEQRLQKEIIIPVTVSDVKKLVGTSGTKN